MVEGGCKEIPEEEIVEALIFGHEAIKPIIALQRELRAASDGAKRERGEPTGKVAVSQPITLALMESVIAGSTPAGEATSQHVEDFRRFKAMAEERLAEAYRTVQKQKRREMIRALRQEVFDGFLEPLRTREVTLNTASALDALTREIRGLRRLVRFHDLEGDRPDADLREKTRIDGRASPRSHRLQGGDPAARPRLGALHARRDPGPGHHHARHVG
jgi:polyribonucleotide nucleotidyltransferase